MAEPSVPGRGGPRHARVRFEGSVATTRFSVLLPVAVLALAALGSFAYGTELFVLAVRQVVLAALPVGDKIGRILVVIDLFLIGATLLIASFGFYELFVGRIVDGRDSHLPAWLQMRDLNDLKARVISMIVLIAAVDFVEVLVERASSVDVLERGAAVAAVVAALTVYVRFGRQTHGAD